MPVTPCNKFVLAFDIVSSSKVLENLHRNSALDNWENLLLGLDRYLQDKREQLQTSKGWTFDCYKFMGDGWILLLEETDRSLVAFMYELSVTFNKLYDKHVKPSIDDPSITVGVKFGLDYGWLGQTTIGSQPEYFGRPINVACRLQGEVSKQEVASGLLSTLHAFGKGLSGAQNNFICRERSLPLRNIVDDKTLKYMFVDLTRLPFPRELAGNWDATFGPKSKPEVAQIDTNGIYRIGGKQVFDLRVTSHGTQHIIWDKIRVKGNTVKSTEELKILSDDELEGFGHKNKNWRVHYCRVRPEQ